MGLMLLLFIPIGGVLLLFMGTSYELSDLIVIKRIKFIALTTTVVNIFISFIMFIAFDNSSNQFQFVQEYHKVSYFDLYLGVDGLSIYFVLLTTIIVPISFLSNWTSILDNIRSNVIIILLLETLLLAVFLVLDILLYYIFFESILPPLFILIGLFGSNERVRASFYLFLYTLLGSLFLLLSIVTMSSTMGTTDLDSLFKTNLKYISQLFLFYGIFIAFAVKTPTIFLNLWLLKAHVESPLGGSIILAGIVLKLSLFGILRLILPLLPKASLDYTYIVYLIGIITIMYASVSTLRTIDVKELIAYSSVSHAAVYLLGTFSNTLQGIEGGITLGLAHGFVSSGLFICAGGVLYDRSYTRLITYYRGIAQLMPLFSVMFFLLCLGNCGVPLTLNFVGEFMSLYGVFVRLPILGVFASSSIIFSAAYSIYMFNRIAFSGSFSKFFLVNIPDINKREFFILLTLVSFTVVLGVYPAPILDGLHYSASSLIYSSFLLSNYSKFFFKKNKIYKNTNLINVLPPKKPNKFILFIKKLFSLIFTKKNFYSWVVIFITGLIVRYFIKESYLEVNIFKDYFNSIFIGCSSLITILRSPKEFIAWLLDVIYAKPMTMNMNYRNIASFVNPVPDTAAGPTAARPGPGGNQTGGPSGGIAININNDSPDIDGFHNPGLPAPVEPATETHGPGHAGKHSFDTQRWLARHPDRPRVSPNVNPSLVPPNPNIPQVTPNADRPQIPYPDYWAVVALDENGKYVFDTFTNWILNRGYVDPSGQPFRFFGNSTGLLADTMQHSVDSRHHDRISDVLPETGQRFIKEYIKYSTGNTRENTYHMTPQIINEIRNLRN